MITINDHILMDEGGGIQYYVINGNVDSLSFTHTLRKDLAEVGGVYDEPTVQACLASIESQILETAEERSVEVHDKIIRAPDFVVATPIVSNDLNEARQQMNGELGKDSKSIALMTIAQTKLLEDLIRRVEALEK